jgi:DNA-binding NtrC family response regulator
MIRVLFVDDDPIVLASLRNLFHRERKTWQMSFASGGHDALVELDTSGFDVVISDMRMPNMDGAELLHAVSERSPTTGRVILTGYSEPETLERARLVAHEVLNKPCPADKLRAAILRHAHCNPTPVQPLPQSNASISTPASMSVVHAQVPTKSP